MIVNSVRELRIGSKTKEVLLDEAPVKFYVEGYDNKGNVFSTLNSLVFKWDAKDRDDVVRMVKFRDSQFSVTSELAGLESKGLQGNMVLYEGIKTGSAQVSVRLMSKASKAAASSAGFLAALSASSFSILAFSRAKRLSLFLCSRSRRL